MKGFRVQPQGSKKDQMRAIDTELKNMQMAGRISQMMIQQLMQNIKSMGDDLGNALNQVYELQYKYTALQKHLQLDVQALNKIANEQRLIDFNEGSIKADQEENLTKTDTVTADSTVVITSSAKDDKGNDKGIFRSRIKLSESGVPDLITNLNGKKVGDKVQVKLNSLDHEVELLTISSPTVVETTQTTEATH
jgi:hypothetical protein